jgi:hypothetical protein
MTVLLRHSGDLPARGEYQSWVALGNFDPLLDPDLRGASAAALEDAFDRAGETWFTLARDMGREQTADLAHTPACVANASDFGVMLAWASLVESWGRESRRTLAICNDPWLFRHLAQQPGVEAGQRPPLARREILLMLRGLAARLAVALRMAVAHITSRQLIRDAPRGGAALLVYNHPRSMPSGHDAYFGDLLRRLSGLSRIVHTDGNPQTAARLGVPLHAFGRLRDLFRLPGARWRPSTQLINGPYGWLIRRSAALEGGGGQAGMIAWQQACQRRWLTMTRPSVIAWPWENHAWERDLVRAARHLGIRTIGYQHSVIGRQMFNYAPKSNPDGLESIPDLIPCSGQATLDQLSDWSMPRERLSIGGALRFPSAASPRYEPSAPVFMALPFDGKVAAQMVAAARTVPAVRFAVRDHPMTPFAFAVEGNLFRAPEALEKQEGVSTVVYAATTVGLEARLAGLPVLRFRPRGLIALDILPKNFTVPAVEAENLGNALAQARRPEPVPRTNFFAPVDPLLWQSWLGLTGKHGHQA